ncbi:leucine-rich repeat-containing protein 56-like [Montipora foliosa]|uniref:leucine-rich repeat-containing protein 56-like n=1 Tax=Montipora foliosa TaxID=591990 RepID=UPI0035F11CBB
MALMEDNLRYSRKSLGMDEFQLTLEEIEAVPAVPREISTVRIREIDDSSANPDPIIQDEEADLLLEEFLSPSKLRSLTGMKNLEEVEYLEMKVDTRDNSLGNFGMLVPNLVELKLNDSIIATIRDLGTSLSNLRTLWLSRSGLVDLDGISSVSSLKELYLSFNHIEDVSPVSMLDQLEILDLEGNNVNDIAQVEFLCLCSSLKILTLEGNPICSAPHPEASSEEIESYEYRAAIHRAVSNVKILDDEPFLVEKVGGQSMLREPPASHRVNKVPKHLKTDFQLVSEGIKAIILEEHENDDDDDAVESMRPGSAAGSARHERPSSAMSTRQRPTSASRMRPSSALGQRPGSAGGSYEPTSTGVFQQDDTSDLTYGSSQVICGNISRALKSRRKDLKQPKLPMVAFLESPRLFTPEKSYEEEADSTANKNDILEELKAWRLEYSKVLSNERSKTSPANETSDGSLNELPPSSPQQDVSASQLSSTTPGYSPSPPSVRSSRFSGSHSVVRRSLPTPPRVGKEIKRPNTAADFRMRRFRQLSGEASVEQLRLQAMQGDESHDVDKNVESRSSPSSSIGDDPRALSTFTPVKVNPRTREMPVRDGTSPLRKLHDAALREPRPGTAAAALQKRKLRTSKD